MIPTEEPLKVGLYLRVSTEEQTIETQILDLKAYCDRQGWQIVGMWSDVLSGSKKKRPGIDKMIDEAPFLEVDAIVTVKLDRLGRSLINVIDLVQTLSKLGIAVICTSQGIDTRQSNPAGRMMLGIMAVFAEFERDMIRERTCAGMRLAKSRGKKLGTPNPNKAPDWAEQVAAYKAAPKETRGSIAKLARRIRLNRKTVWRYVNNRKR